MTDAGGGRLRWPAVAAAALWYAVILATVPLARSITNPLRDAHLLAVATSAGFGLFVIAIAALLYRLHRRGRLEPRQSVAVIALTALAIGLAQLIELPEVRWHLIQYGVLGALLWLCPRATGWRRAVPALVIATACGWVEEGVQYLVPERYYDLEDVLLNAVSGAVGVGIMQIGSLAKRGGS